MDRWLKKRGEPGFDDEDARLLDNAARQERMSFHYLSSRYPDRKKNRQLLGVIRKGC